MATVVFSLVPMAIARYAIVSAAVVAVLLVMPVCVSRRPFSLFNHHRPLLHNRRPPHSELEPIRRNVNLRTSLVHFVKLPMPQRRLMLQFFLVPQRPLMRL